MREKVLTGGLETFYFRDQTTAAFSFVAPVRIEGERRPSHYNLPIRSGRRSICRVKTSSFHTAHTGGRFVRGPCLLTMSVRSSV